MGLPSDISELWLRPTTVADLPLLHAMQVDPEANRLAGIKPEGWGTLEAYTARWVGVLADPAVTPRVIVLGGEVVGTINVAPSDGKPSLGYWIAREWWGRGVATRAIALFLTEYTERPLSARAWARNIPSIRALERGGFVVTDRIQSPETSKAHAREMVLLILRERGAAGRERDSTGRERSAIGAPHAPRAEE